MSAYFVANIRIHDEEEYAKYLQRVDDVFAKFNGKYLAVAKSPEVVEGSWDYSRLILIEFPNMDALKRWYGSEAYQEILRHRLAAADCDSVVFWGN